MKLKRIDQTEHIPTVANKLEALDIFIRWEERDEEHPVVYMRVHDNDETGVACVVLGCTAKGESVDGVGELESIKTNEKVIIIDAELRFRLT